MSRVRETWGTVTEISNQKSSINNHWPVSQVRVRSLAANLGSPLTSRLGTIRPACYIKRVRRNRTAQQVPHLHAAIRIADHVPGRRCIPRHPVVIYDDALGGIADPVALHQVISRAHEPDAGRKWICRNRIAENRNTGATHHFNAGILHLNHRVTRDRRRPRRILHHDPIEAGEKIPHNRIHADRRAHPFCNRDAIEAIVNAVIKNPEIRRCIGGDPRRARAQRPIPHRRI